ncbi:MAG: fasciclin domain-containing protein [Candidatus Poseidoniales archaeon]|nr:fasciclin domain-containing protein [Candidatus Poseidoniales archaeon]
MRKSLVYTFVACLLLAAMPYSVVADATEDIPTNAAGTGVHDSLVAALVQADLVTTLEGDGPFTVFAPTDQAFTDAGIDLAAFDTDEEIAALADILLYHVVAGTILSTDLADGDNDVVAANGDKLTVTLDAGTVTVGADDATVTTADVVSSNGVIHVIDKVLTPPAGEICYNVITHTIVAGASNLECNSYMYVENYTMGGQTITGCYNTVTHQVTNTSAAVCGAYMWTPAVSIAMTAQATTIHTALVAALGVADLVTTLSGDTEYTVFAPSDDAFAAAGIDLDTFDTNEEIAALADILLYHVVAGSIPSAALADGANTVVAANGDKLTVTVADGSVTVGADGAAVTLADVPASNGVIHVIDKVLTPPAGEICYNVITHTIVAGASNLECNSYMYVENYTMGGQTITGCYNTVTHQVADVTAAVCGAYMWTPAVNIAMTAQATTIHTALVAALGVADLVTTLSGDTEYTVFAPSDDAFAAAGIDLDTFDTDEEIAALADILLYHVVAGTTLSTDLADGANTVSAANGKELTITVADGAVTVGAEGATVTLADVPASNGVIHVIDKVLTPPAADPFEGIDCAATIGLTSSGYGFTPSVVNIEPGQTVCWSWTDASMGHNVKQVDGFESNTYVDGGVTSGQAATTVAFHHTFTENQTFYYACEPHISMKMHGEVVVGDGGVQPAADTKDTEDAPGFVASSMMLAILGAVLFMSRRQSQ